ncbi:MAG: hypothetical protein HY959_03540 [Ignavibacteriae bacterium]|nr:hypothetical protein [Ignavibacteriota bacterium]
MIFDVRNTLNTVKNPLYKHTKLELWLAYKGSEIVGRIAGIVNDNHNKFHNDKVGFWGYFDCINDKEVSGALFDTVKDFLIANGMDTMRGPVNPSTNDEIGLLINAFDKPAVMLMTYNPEYYIGLVEEYGFVKSKELYAYHVSEKIVNNKAAMDKLERVANIVLKREKLTIRKINVQDFDNEVKLIQEIYNKAWIKNWGFVPMTDDEFKYLAKNLKAVIDKDLIYLAEFDGKPVGFSLALPDYNQVFIKMNGKLFPFGVFKLLAGRKKINSIRLITLGVIHEFQKKGTEAVFILNTIKEGLAKGYKGAEISWILEDNGPMVATADNLGAELYKKYRIYDKQISNNR